MTDLSDSIPVPHVTVVALNTDVAQPGTSTGQPATHMVTLSNGTNLFFHETRIPIALRDPDGNIILGEVEGIEEDDLVSAANVPAGTPPIVTAPPPPPLAEAPAPVETPPPTEPPPADVTAPSPPPSETPA